MSVIPWSSRVWNIEAKVPILIRWFIPNRSPRFTLWAILWRTAIIFSSVGIIAAMEGNLGAHRSANQFFDDIRRLFMMHPQASTTAQIPLLRDYGALLQIWMIAYISVHSKEFLRLINSTIHDMRSVGSLRPKNQSEFLTRLYSASARMNSRWTVSGILLLSVATSYAGLASYHRWGIYPGLGPTNDRHRFAIESAANWWAGAETWGYYGFLFWAVVGNFVDIWVAYAAGELAFLLFASERDLIFRLDLRNSDGDWGWATPVQLILEGRRIIVAASVGIFGVILIANPSGAQYLLVFPGYLAVSIFLFGLPDRFYFKARIEALRTRSDLADQLAWLVMVPLMPRRIVPLRTGIYQILLVAVPGTFTVWSALK